MEYTNVHIGAVVGQLAMLLRQLKTGDISEKEYNNATSYNLSRMTAFSRYHVVNILELALDRGLVVRVEREHRPDVRKYCYHVTVKGLEFIQSLKDQGKYQSSLMAIRYNHFLKAKNSVTEVEYNYFEYILQQKREGKI